MIYRTTTNDIDEVFETIHNFPASGSVEYHISIHSTIDDSGARQWNIEVEDDTD